jgi:hypothetical protein
MKRLGIATGAGTVLLHQPKVSGLDFRYRGVRRHAQDDVPGTSVAVIGQRCKAGERRFRPFLRSIP